MVVPECLAAADGEKRTWQPRQETCRWLFEMIRLKYGLTHQLCMLTLLSGSISVKISFLG